MTSKPKIVIIGAGFGGLYAAKALVDRPVDVLIIDRQNYHLFTPLLYQVATAGLESEEIAHPVRSIFRQKANIHFRLGEVEAIQPDEKTVVVRANGKVEAIPYDFLIVAAGSVTHYFGQESVRQHGFGMKDLSEALTLRNHILEKFERAAWSDDRDYQAALTTVVVVGGGPTGLETAGALAELYHQVLSKQYEFLRTVKPRVILVEALDRLLTPFPASLQKAALEQIESLGVEVILNTPVEEVTESEVQLKDGRVIPTYTLIWSAGVKASPLAEMLGVELHKSGRVPIKPTTELRDRDGIYVVGDMAYLEDRKGQPYPMLIPVAQQQGRLAAENILLRLDGEPEKVFRYFDRGIMATIGRSRAVAWAFNRIKLRGYLAWIAWLGLHLVVLIGFRNRVNVLINWVWHYLFYQAISPIILETSRRETHKRDPQAEPATFDQHA